MIKILCTGNPDHRTIASGIKKIFPYASFASRSTGFDLRMWDQESEQYFRKNIVKYNILINSSFIANGAQQKILEVTSQEWKTGHVINIGSTAEYEGRKSTLPQTYCIQKRSLRDLSLSLNSKYFKTTHMIVGGINDGLSGHEQWLDPIAIAEVIKYVIESKIQIPIIGVE